MQNNLPEGWISIPFKQIVKKIPLTHKKLKQKEYLREGKLPVIDQGQNFIGGYTNNDQLIVDCKLPIILFGDHTRIVKFVNQKFVAGADGVKILEPNPNLNPSLVYYFTKIIHLPNKGYARHYQYLEKSIMYVPPLNEQKRIVAKIASIFAQIDAKQKKLIILENQIKFMQDSIHELKCSILKQAFKDLEDRYVLKTLDNVCADIQAGFAQGEKNIKNGIIHLRMNNVSVDFTMNFELLRTINATSKQKEKYSLEKNDVIFVNTNSAELVGKSAIFTFDKPCLYSNHLSRLRADTSVLNPKWLLYYIQFRWMKHDFTYMCNKWINQAAISSAKIKQLQIPTPSIETQRKLIAKIESIFGKIDAKQKKLAEMELQLKSIPDSVGALKRSILKLAFEGKLVPQNPNDEPASVLLERIKPQQSKRASNT